MSKLFVWYLEFYFSTTNLLYTYKDSATVDNKDKTLTSLRVKVRLNKKTDCCTIFPVIPVESRDSALSLHTFVYLHWCIRVSRDSGLKMTRVMNAPWWHVFFFSFCTKDGLIGLGIVSILSDCRKRSILVNWCVFFWICHFFIANANNEATHILHKLWQIY